MTGFRVDADVFAEYANTLDKAADQLSATDAAFNATTLTSESLGDLGQQTGAVDAYARAATLLRHQLTDGTVALRSASDALRQVNERHTGTEHQAKTQITKAADL